MGLTADSREQRVKALTRLALATREKMEAASYVIYVEDTAWFSTDVLTEACRRLETSSAWFPKVSELIEECRMVAQRKQEQRGQKLLRAPIPDPVSPEKMQEFMAQIRRLTRSKSFPK